jgi:hypothetical protein
MADPRPADSKQNEDATRSPSGADLLSLLLLILFGFGVWAVVERGFTELLRKQEPNEQKLLDTNGVTKKKAELTDVQNEIAEIQKYLNAARLEQLKQNAAVQSYVLTYPQLQEASSSANVPPPETVKAYTETRRQAASAFTVVIGLEKRLAELKPRHEVLSAEVDANKEAVESQFRWANGWYVILKRVGTFVGTLAIVLVILWLVRIVLWIFAKKRMSTAEGFRPFAWALAALVLLFAYDQFSFAGAALVGVLLLLVILRRIKWPQRSGAALK